MHDDVPGNVCYDWSHGDAAAVDAAFARAAKVTSLEFVNNRLVPNAMEPRAANAVYSRHDDSYTLYVANQNPHVERLLMCAFVLGLPESKVRVIAPDVGGGFGSKIFLYPEETALIWASKRVGRPIKWTAERSESFLTDAHGRDHVTKAQLALDEKGNFLAMRVDDHRQHGRLPVHLRVVGAHHPLCHPARRTVQDAGHLLHGQGGVHQHRAGGRLSRRRPAGSDLRGRAPGGARGARHEHGSRRHPPAELHHRVPVRHAGRADLRHRQLRRNPRPRARDGRRRRLPGAQGARRRSSGKLRGLGYSCYIEACGLAPSNIAGALGARAGLFEAGEVRVHPTGTVTVFTGSHSHGQGHETTFAQVVAGRLGIPVENVEIVHGDTGRVPFGMGTYGSRSLSVGGTAIVKAVDKIIAKGKKIAAHLLEAADTDIVYENGEFKVAGTDRKVPFGQVALTAYVPHNYPLDKLEPGLNENAFYDPTNFTYPAGSYVCEVEIDKAHRHRHGGEVHRGRRLRQHHQPDDRRRPGAGRDRAGPRAGHDGSLRLRRRRPAAHRHATWTMPCRGPADLPDFDIDNCVTPCTHNPLGVKGCGEAGAIGSPPAFINALTDALGHENIAMPATPERVWRALQQPPPPPGSRAPDQQGETRHVRIRLPASRHRWTMRSRSAAATPASSPGARAWCNR